MLFNSYAFIFGFLPITLVIYFGLGRLRLTTLATAWLVITSLAFYAYWDVYYLLLLTISILFNYLMGRWIESAKPTSRKAKLLLVLGICFNIGLLSYYKYANFFLASFNQVFHTSWDLPNIILPLGISFYSFTQIAYLVDAYLGKNTKYNFLIYNLFVTFFPQLIAGPILHHKEIVPQFYRIRTFIFSYKNFNLGLTLFILGLFKKVAIADNLAPWVAPVFNNADSLSFMEAWVGALAYTLQLYFDFSGYSDMAIGLGWMFNINLPVNFDSPYKSTSIIDFWRRWHITLSNFLRDYLYIPLGGNRLGKIRQYINLLTTMILGGLWHGAGWTFIFWGGMHGLFLVINHVFRRLEITLPKILAWLLTFVAIVCSWVVFRTQTINDASNILQAMFGLRNFVMPISYQGFLRWLMPLGVEFKSWQEFKYLPDIGGQKSLIVLAILVLYVTLLPNTQQIMQWFKPNWRWALLLAILASFCLISMNRVSEFLYFQF